MPLHREHGQIGVCGLDRLDDAVVGPRRGHPSRCDVVDRLVMDRVHDSVTGLPVRLGEPAPGGDADLPLAEDLVGDVADRAVDPGAGDLLVQRAPERRR